ncbi:MAG: MFS transporter [Acidimicrobiia bacterium]
MDIESIQRRTLRVLVLGQLAAAAALSSSVTVGAFVVQRILGQSTPWGGIATATVTIGTAFMAQVLSRRMARTGRRQGLVIGYAAAIGGGLLAGVGAEAKSLPLFVVGLFVYGSGQAANLLSRYAATDLAPADRRGAAMSRILFASTFGAVLGPVLVLPAQAAGESWFGWNKYTGPWVFGALFFVFSLFNAALRLRPDPLTLARELRGEAVGSVPSVRIRESFRRAFATPNGRVAVFAMVIAQMTMVAVMTMTPVHLKAHDQESISSYVVSLHIAGMYAFSPWVGRFADRRGRLRTIQVGAVLLAAATALSALAGDAHLLSFPALWLLGVGWSFGLIGGSSLLIDSVSEESRVSVQGSADMAMSFFGGLAGFSSGFIRKAVGYHVLSTFALVLALSLGVLSTLMIDRRDRHTPVTA